MVDMTWTLVWVRVWAMVGIIGLTALALYTNGAANGSKTPTPRGGSSNG